MEEKLEKFADLSLKQIADELKRRVSSSRSSYVEFGKLLIVAREKCNQNKISWLDWTRDNIRKLDGQPFSHKTLENYIYLAGGEHRVEKQKEMQRENIKKTRKAANWRTRSATEVIASLLTKNKSLKDQIDILMAVWECAGEAAQEEFLKNIGVRL